MMILFPRIQSFNAKNYYRDQGLGSALTVPINPLSSCGFGRDHKIDSFVRAIWPLHTCRKLYREWVLS